MKPYIVFTIFLNISLLNATIINQSTTSFLANSAYKGINNTNVNNTDIKSYVTNEVKYYKIEDEKNTVIVFRGTANKKNLMTDIKGLESKFLNKDMKVHKGFYDIVIDVDKKLKLSKTKPVVLVGHSLGGATALLYGAILKKKNYNVEVYSFGMPPVGDKKFIKEFSDMSHHRYFHVFDPIPMLYKPTVASLKKQLNLKKYLNSKKTISSLITTIIKTPETFAHHGTSHELTGKVYQSDEDKKQSLFFKTLSLPFFYHKIDNYSHALAGVKEDKKIKPIKNKPEEKVSFLDKMQVLTNKMATTPKVIKKENHPKIDNDVLNSIEIIASATRGTNPFNVEFYIKDNGHKINAYYSNIDGKENITKKILKHKINHTFTTSGKHNVKIAIRSNTGKLIQKEFIIETRNPTFEEYKEQTNKAFDKFKASM